MTTTKTQEADAITLDLGGDNGLILPIHDDCRVAVILSPLRKLSQRKRLRYAQKLAQYTLDEFGAWPLATHLMLNGIITPGESQTTDEEALCFQRSLIDRADFVVVGIDYGASKGMKNGIDFAKTLGKEIHMECIGRVDPDSDED